MSFFDALVTEAKDAGSIWAVLALIFVVITSRAIHGVQHQRLPGSIGLLAIHGVLLLVTAALTATGRDGAREARIAAHILLAMGSVGVGGAFVFGVVMQRTRRRIPRIVQDLIVVLITLVVVIAVLSRFGISLAGLFATSAVVTAVVGLSVQDVLGNTMGGLALQADGSISVGDWIKVGDITGRVADIRWRYTAVETRNWETVLVPNAVLMKGPVTVLGRRTGQPELWRRWVYFNVDFRYPASEVIDSVTGALHGLDRVSPEPTPDCVLMDLHESYGRYAVRYWLTDLAKDDPTDSLVRTRIMFALKRANIPLSIPAHAIFVTEESKKRKDRKSETEKQRRVDALHQVELFAPLDDDEIATLAESLHPAPFTEGEVITRQGAEAHWLYLVVHGTVAVKVKKDGSEAEIARLTDGSFFGEMSLMTGEPRSATVVAVTHVDCYRLEKVSFQKLVKNRPEVAEPIAELLAERQGRRALLEENLSADARAKRKRDDEHALLHRMKSFFGLE